MAATATISPQALHQASFPPTCCHHDDAPATLSPPVGPQITHVQLESLTKEACAYITEHPAVVLVTPSAALGDRAAPLVASSVEVHGGALNAKWRSLGLVFPRMISSQQQATVSVYSHLHASSLASSPSTPCSAASSVFGASSHHHGLSPTPMEDYPAIHAVIAAGPTHNAKFRKAASLNGQSEHFICIVENFRDGKFFAASLNETDSSDALVDAFSRALVEYAQGTLPRAKLGAPRPFGDRRPTTPPPLFDAVTASFGDLVINQRVDTLVCYWSPKCPCCPCAVMTVATLVQAFDAVASSGCDGLPARPAGSVLRGVLYNVEENDYDETLISTVPALHLYPSFAGPVSANGDVAPQRRPVVFAISDDDEAEARDVKKLLEWLFANGGPEIQRLNTEQGRAAIRRQLCPKPKRGREEGGGGDDGSECCFNNGTCGRDAKAACEGLPVASSVCTSKALPYCSGGMLLEPR